MAFGRSTVRSRSAPPTPITTRILWRPCPPSSWLSRETSHLRPCVRRAEATAGRKCHGVRVMAISARRQIDQDHVRVFAEAVEEDLLAVTRDIEALHVEARTQLRE